MAKGRYEESSIRVLKGLEPVRERPGMYTRTTDPTHIIAEVIDNAADEALAGYATRIDVRVHADQSIRKALHRSSRFTRRTGAEKCRGVGLIDVTIDRRRRVVGANLEVAPLWATQFARVLP